MGKVNIAGRMADSTKVNTSKTRSMATVFTYTLMVASTKVPGHMESKTAKELT